MTECLKTTDRLEVMGRLVAEAKYVMVFVVTCDGRITACNALASKTFGYTEREVLSQHMNTPFGSAKDEVWRRISESVSQEMQWRGELVGICMVASGCPIVGKLKPMVRYHLPFATLKETQYRVISMYLLAQYFLYKRGMKPDWELKNLVKMYGDIQIVNKGLFRRLAHIKIGDATLNALIKLDIFAKHVSDCISQDVLNEMEHLFAGYFVGEDNASR